MVRKKQLPEESEKRAQILQTAGKMFMAQGFDAISMDALAEAVPVSKRTLYNHFEDKQALFTAVMQSRCKSVFDALSHTIDQNLAVEDTLTLIGEQFLGVIFEPDALNIYRVAITEALKFPDLGKLFYESGPMRSTALLASYFRKLHDEGELFIDDPDLAANVFLGMLANRMQMKCMLGLQKQVSQTERKKLVDYAVNIFLAAHTPE